MPGVMRADVSFENETALVTFDDSVADTAALIAATAGVGYPARLVDASGG